MKIVILGGGGFIGTHLSRRLIDVGHDVRVFGRNFLDRQKLSGAEIFQGDFGDPTVVSSAIAGSDVVVHLIHATFPAVANIEMAADIDRSVISSVRMLNAASAQGVRRVVFLSSGGTVYGPSDQKRIDEGHPTNPISAYGINKLAIEKYVALHEALHGLEGFSLRLANPYGPLQTGSRQQGLVPTVYSRVMSGQPISIYGDGSATRDYVYISDVVDAIAGIVAYTGRERCFNLGSTDEGKSILDVVSAIETATGKSGRIEFRPRRFFDVQSNVLDCDRIVGETGWRPKVDFSDGIARTIDWLADRA